MSDAKEKAATTAAVATEPVETSVSELLGGHTVCIDTLDWIQSSGQRYQFDMRHIFGDEIEGWYNDAATVGLGAWIIPQSTRHVQPTVATATKEATAAASSHPPPPSPSTPDAEKTNAPQPSSEASSPAVEPKSPEQSEGGGSATPEAAAAKSPPPPPPLSKGGVVGAESPPLSAAQKKSAKRRAKKETVEATKKPRFVPNATLKLSVADVDVICTPLAALVDLQDAQPYERFLEKSSLPMPWKSLSDTLARGVHAHPAHLQRAPALACCVYTKDGEKSLNATVKAMTHISRKRDINNGFSFVGVFPFTYEMTLNPVPMRLILVRLLRAALTLLKPIIEHAQGGATKESPTKIDWTKFVLELGLACDETTLEINFLVRVALFDTYEEHEFAEKCVTIAQFRSKRMNMPEDVPKPLERISKARERPSVALFHVDLRKQTIGVGQCHFKAKVAASIAGAAAAAAKPGDKVNNGGDTAAAPSTTPPPGVVVAEIQRVVLADSAEALVVDVDTYRAKFTDHEDEQTLMAFKFKVLDFVNTILGGTPALDLIERNVALDGLRRELLGLIAVLSEKSKDDEEGEDDEEEKEEEKEKTGEAEDGKETGETKPQKKKKKKPSKDRKLESGEANVLNNDMIAGAAVAMSSLGPFLEGWRTNLPDKSAESHAKAQALKQEFANFITTTMAKTSNEFKTRMAEYQKLNKALEELLQTLAKEEEADAEAEAKAKAAATPGLKTMNGSTPSPLLESGTVPGRETGTSHEDGNDENGHNDGGQKEATGAADPGEMV